MRNCKSFLVGQLFITWHVDNTSKDATPPFQGKRKHVHVLMPQVKKRILGRNLKISIATDEGANRETDTSKARRTTTVGAMIAATILKSIVDCNYFGLVTGN